jgi:PAS domain S-box-containing protein
MDLDEPQNILEDGGDGAAGRSTEHAGEAPHLVPGARAGGCADLPADGPLLVGNDWFVEYVERSPLPIAVTKGKTHSLLSVNPALRELIGATDRELLGHPFGELIPQADRPNGALELLDLVYRTGEAMTDAEVQHRHASDGDVSWWSFTVWPVALQGDGSADGLVIQINDVTRAHGDRADQRMQAAQTRDVNERLLVASLHEEELAARAVAAQERAGFLADASAVLASSLDLQVTIESLAKLTVPFLADWCIVHIASTAEALRQVIVAHTDPRKEQLAIELEQRFPWQPIIDGVLAHGEPVLLPVIPATIPRGGNAEYEQLRGELSPRSGIAVPILVGDEVSGVITLIISESERKYGPEDLGLAQALARHAALAITSARRMAEVAAASNAKSRFLATMSHELRTPLTAIMGYSDLLADGITDRVTARQQKQLRRIKVSAEHLLGLIDEILTLSRVEAGSEVLRREAVDVGALFEMVTTLVEPLAMRKHIALQVRAPEPPITLETDPAKVRQILVNLAGNAVKFTQDGEIALSASAEGGRVMLTVSDTGIGISPAYIEQVFEPFWQVEQECTRRVGGTGLGLSVSRRLARLLDGDLTVESTIGEGSTFTLTLPGSSPSGQ